MIGYVEEIAGGVKLAKNVYVQTYIEFDLYFR